MIVQILSIVDKDVDRLLGQYLAVGWSDGIVEVISAETGSVLQHFRQVTASGKRAASSKSNSSLDVTCVGWGLNFIDVPAVKAKTRTNGASVNRSTTDSLSENLTTDNRDEDDESVSLDGFLERLPDFNKIDIPLDLPEQLARVDVTSLLPKLPALPLLPPAAYKNGDHPAAELFSSQVSMDALLTTHSVSQTLNGLDALLLAQGDGSVRLVLYDSLSIGTIALPSAWTVQSPRFLKHASHPFSRSHMFLAEFPPEGNKGTPRTAIIPLSLRFMQSAGSHLHMIEHKTAQLETLVQYVNECLLAISHHWSHAKELPGRFMENVNETLKENDQPSLVQSLFHLAVTGDCPATLKEWLVDILAERVRCMIAWFENSTHIILGPQTLGSRDQPWLHQDT
jgi:anaphase-promoting complex subunit 4